MSQKETLSGRVDPVYVAEFNRICKAEDRTPSYMVEKAVIEYVDNWKKSNEHDQGDGNEGT